MSRTILVAGASGALGSEIVRLLLARGDRVRALGRDASRLARLRAAGVETVVADAADAAALRPAVDGVDAVISSLGASTLPSPSLGWRGFGAVDLKKNRNLVDAAKAAGAKKMVYVSVFHDPDMRRGAYVDAHERVVDHLRGSGLAWSEVRPTGFFSAVGTFVDMAKNVGLPPIVVRSTRTKEVGRRNVLVSGLPSRTPAPTNDVSISYTAVETGKRVSGVTGFANTVSTPSPSSTTYSLYAASRR